MLKARRLENGLIIVEVFGSPEELVFGKHYAKALTDYKKYPVIHDVADEFTFDIMKSLDPKGKHYSVFYKFTAEGFVLNKGKSLSGSEKLCTLMVVFDEYMPDVERKKKLEDFMRMYKLSQKIIK